MARAKKRSDGRFCVTLTVGKTADGKPIRKGFYSSVSITDAKAKKDEYMRTHNYGGDGQPTPKYDGSVTLAKWCDVWLTTYKATVEPNTQDFYRSAARRICAFEMDGVRFGEMEIGAFLPIHITKYLASLQGLSKSLIRRDKGTLLQIFQAAKTNGMIPRDFAEDLRETVGQQRIKGTYDGHKALSRYWIDFIGQHYDEHRFGLFVMISMWTGLRPGEVCALTWDDIDLFRGTITVSKSLDLRHGSIIKDTKTAAGNRELPILPPLKKALLKAHKDSGTICCREDGSPHKQRSMEAAFDSFRSYIEQRANGVPIGTAGQGFRRDYWDRKHPDAGWKTFDYSQYDLRSTFCTLLYDSGVDIKTAQKLMGHKDAQTTMRIYTKLSEEHETESVQQMTDFISRTFSL